MRHKRVVGDFLGSFRIDPARALFVVLLFIAFFALFRFGISTTSQAIDHMVQKVATVDIAQAVSSQNIALINSIEKQIKDVASKIVMYGILLAIYSLVISFLLITSASKITFASRMTSHAGGHRQAFLDRLISALKQIFSEPVYYLKGLGLGFTWLLIFIIPILFPLLYLLKTVSVYDFSGIKGPMIALGIILSIMLHFMLLSFYYLRNLHRFGASIGKAFSSGIRLHRLIVPYAVIFVFYLLIFWFLVPHLISYLAGFADGFFILVLSIFLAWAIFYYALVLKSNFPVRPVVHPNVRPIVHPVHETPKEKHKQRLISGIKMHGRPHDDRRKRNSHEHHESSRVVTKSIRKKQK
ncbi:hypothetical protein JW968_03545 [Candidatus Woesearchaeota archaeon]|nr:hypothetical protein [Candidatus Woesearchaeota archaeon]